jgi:integration host factor subunit beta
MTKSELIAMLANKQPHLQQKDVDLAVNNIVQVLTTAIASGERIEIRGFGGFSTKSRQPRIGRNPKTGESVSLPNRQAVHFKAGLDLKKRVNASRSVIRVIKDDD